MGLKYPKKKPTNKEMAGIIIELNSRVNKLNDYVSSLDKIIGMILEMNGQGEKFNQFIKEKTEELKNDAKANEKPDKLDIQGDTDNEGSGTEGVREEGK